MRPKDHARQVCFKFDETSRRYVAGFSIRTWVVHIYPASFGLYRLPRIEYSTKSSVR